MRRILRRIGYAAAVLWYGEFVARGRQHGEVVLIVQREIDKHLRLRDAMKTRAPIAGMLARLVVQKLANCGHLKI